MGSSKYRNRGKGAVAKIGINLTEAELQANFTLDSKGVVGWVAGKEPTRETDEENNQQQPTKTLSSIAVSGTYKTEYEVGDTFDNTGLVVTATYSDGSEENVTSSVTYEPTLDTQLATTNTSITVTYEDKTDIVNITVEEVTAVTTLGDLLPDPVAANMPIQEYGYSVSGYTAGGVSEWSIFYEDATNGYVFLIATNNVGNQELALTLDDTAGVTAANSSELYKKFKLGQTGYTLNSSYDNSKAVAYLVNDFGAYANPTNSNIASYVEGAIGGPSIELFAAAYKAKVGTTITVGTDTYGYTVNGTYYQSITNDGFYSNSSYAYWLASPSYNFSTRVMYVGDGSVHRYDYSASRGVRPVVCLKSNIPATLSGTTFTIGN